MARVVRVVGWGGNGSGGSCRNGENSESGEDGGGCLIPKYLRVKMSNPKMSKRC